MVVPFNTQLYHESSFQLIHGTEWGYKEGQKESHIDIIIINKDVITEVVKMIHMLFWSF